MSVHYIWCGVKFDSGAYVLIVFEGVFLDDLPISQSEVLKWCAVESGPVSSVYCLIVL